MLKFAPISRLLVLALLLGLGGAVAQALPKVDQPIDASRAATLSPRDAKRVTPSRPVGRKMKGSGRVPAKAAPARTATLRTPQAPVVVAERRAKKMRSTPPVQQPTAVRSRSVKRAGELPAGVPRLEGGRFQRILSEYREGVRPARAQRIQIGTSQVGMAEVNRYADPRATLERQGIPVIRAGEDEAEAPADRE